VATKGRLAASGDRARARRRLEPGTRQTRRAGDPAAKRQAAQSGGGPSLNGLRPLRSATAPGTRRLPGPWLRPHAADPRWGAGHSRPAGSVSCSAEPPAPEPWAVREWAAVAAHRFAASHRPVGPLLSRSGHLPDHGFASASMLSSYLCPCSIRTRFFEKLGAATAGAETDAR